MKGLEKILEKIEADSKKEADKYRENAEITIARLKSEAIDAGIRLEKEYKQRTENGIAQILSRATGASLTEHRDILLAKKAEIVDSVFEKALQKLRAMKEAEYVPFITRALVHAIYERIDSKTEILRLYGESEADMSEPFEVIFSKKDKRLGFSERIFEGAKVSIKGGATLILSELDADIDGGFILRNGDIDINCSLSAMVEEARTKCEAGVIKKLFS